MTEAELDRLLQQAAQDVRNLSLERLPEESDSSHVFSDRFEAQMQKILVRNSSAKQPSYRKFLRRAASFLLISCVGISALVLGSDAWREQLFVMVERKNSDYSEISYQSKDGLGILSQDFQLTEKQPAYLPEGYLLTNQMLDRSINWSTYTNQQGDRISYSQTVNAQEGFGMGLSINTEDAELQPFLLKGNSAYKMSNQGTQCILWNDDIYNYMLLTTLPMQQALEIAQSIENVPKDAYHPPHLEDVHSLTDNYTLEQARENGDVILLPDDAEQTELIDRLLTNAKNKQADIIRITDFTGEHVVARELYFDGFRFHYNEEHLEKFSSFGYEGKQILQESSENGKTILSLIDSQGEKIEICRY